MRDSRQRRAQQTEWPLTKNTGIPDHAHTSALGGGDYAWADFVAADVTYLQALVADILQGNLVDKSAVEAIAGIWTFNAKFISTKGRVRATTRIISTDSPYTILATDQSIHADTDGGVITMNLPAGIDGTEYSVKNTGTSGNAITLAPNGAELLFGVNGNQTIYDREVLDVDYETTEGWG